MAVDKRAARLGVLALVGTMLFGLVGARLWFLQTVEQENLPAQVDLYATEGTGAFAPTSAQRKRLKDRIADLIRVGRDEIALGLPAGAYDVVQLFDDAHFALWAERIPWGEPMSNR